MSSERYRVNEFTLEGRVRRILEEEEDVVEIHLVKSGQVLAKIPAHLLKGHTRLYRFLGILAGRPGESAPCYVHVYRQISR
ncbi:MAG: hypothetical protein KM310_05625 [Clostridiales bacterium]|nr:hypothetical protein [Clostridiales bacterium]